jgi:hypothetical protein
MINTQTWRDMPKGLNVPSTGRRVRHNCYLCHASERKNKHGTLKSPIGPLKTDVELKREWKNRSTQTDNSL